MPGRNFRTLSAVAALAVAIASLGAPPARAASGTPASVNHREAYYYYSLSQEERLRRNYLQSTKYLRKALEFDPASSFLHLELARLLRTLRQNDAALAEIAETLRIDPADAEAHRLAADIHVSLMDAGVETQDNLKRAIEHYEKALAAEPDADEVGLALGRLYYYQGEADKALSVLQRYHLQNPDSAEANFWRAKVYLSKQDLDQAEAALRQALEQVPYSYESLLTLANVQEMREQYDQAIGTCEKALAVAQDSIEVRYALARLALKRSDFARAAREYVALLSLMKQRRPWVADSELADLYLFTARAQWFSDDTARALETVREGSTEFSGDARFRLLEGELLIETGKDREGEAALEAVLARPDTDAEMRERVADAFFSQGASRERQKKYDKAELYLKRAVTLNPRHAGALNYLGYMLTETSDRYSEAMEYIERAVTLEPDNGDYLDSLGWVYFKLNRLEEAEKRLRQAVERSQENAVACDHLGDVLMALGHPQDALHMWQTALEQAKGLDQPEKVRDKIETVRRRKQSPKS